MSSLLAQLATTFLGDRRTFTRSVIIPHIFVFVVLIVVGTTQQESTAALVARVTAIAGLIAFHQFVTERRRYFSALHLLSEVMVLCVGLATYSLNFHLHPIPTVFLPLVLIILSLFLIEIPWRTGLLLSLSLLSLLGLYSLVLHALGIAPFDSLLSGFAFLLPSLGLLIILGALRNSQPYRPRGDEDRLPSTPLAGARGSLRPRVTEQRDHLLPAASRMFADEALSEIMWRLPITSVAASAIVWVVYLGVEAKNPVFIPAWIIVMIFHTLFLRDLFAQRQIHRVYRNAAVVSGLSMCFWLFLPLFDRGSVVTQQLLLASLAVGILPLPWPRRYNLTFTVLLATCCIVSVLPKISASLPALFVLVLLAILCRSAAIHYVTVCSRSALAVVRRYCDDESDPLMIIRLMMWQLLHLGDGARGFIIRGGSRGEIVSRDRLVPVGVDDILVQGLAAYIRRGNAREGMFETQPLREQYERVFREWFGTLPRQVFYITLEAVVEEQSVEVIYVIPVSITARLAGITRVFRALTALAMFAKLALRAARSHHEREQALQSNEGNLLEREREFNHLVHQVNNAAQEITMECDNLREKIGSMTPAALAEGSRYRQVVIGVVDQLEASSKLLSYGVSDAKLLTEVLRSRSFQRSEHPTVRGMLDELEFFGVAWSDRRGFTFVIRDDLRGEARVAVPSRDLLEAVVRALIQVAGSRLVGSGKIELRVSSRDQEVQFSVSDSGDRVVHQGDENNSSSWRGNAMRAAGALADICNGTFKYTKSERPYTTCMTLSLPMKIAQRPKRPAGTATRWALFVDDNPEVTTFYSRVADAIGLTHHVAASIEESEAIIAAHGRPYFVITDLQLGTQSGIDVISRLRERFGADLEILVVSGNTDAASSEGVRSHGVTKFLTKPVGRKRLFAEISAILDHE